LPEKLHKYLPEAAKKSAESIFSSIVVAQKYAPGTPERHAIDQAYRESQHLLGIAATGVAAVPLILMWFIRDVPLEKNIQGAEEKSEDKPKEGISN
ncbi:hypothetical protein FQN49_007482, partial [Arthroderma sp. PD_2]